MTRSCTSKHSWLANAACVPIAAQKFAFRRKVDQRQQSGSSDQHLADVTKAADRAVGARAAAAHTPGASAAKSPIAKPVQPAASRAASAPRGVADPIGEAPEAVWYVRPPSGGQYGPADGEIMRRWLDEGRVGADSLVWREGWPDWKTATSVFASLRQATSQLVEPGPSQAAAEPLEDPFAVDDKKARYAPWHNACRRADL